MQTVRRLVKMLKRRFCVPWLSFSLLAEYVFGTALCLIVLLESSVLRKKLGGGQH